MRNPFTRTVEKASAPSNDETRDFQDEAVGVHLTQGQPIQIVYPTFPPERISPMPVTTLFSNEINFRGSLHQEGGCVIEGNVDAEIHLLGTNSTLEIREGSTFAGKVKAGEVLILGNANADIEARHVVIEDSAVTRGKVSYQTISIQGGDNEIALKRSQAN